MNRHRPAELIARGLCIDGIEDAVNRLVAAGAENGRTKDLLRRGIGKNLHEAESLVLLDRTADTSHWTGGGKIRQAAGTHLCFGHADSPERRINEERVSKDTITDAPFIAVEQIGGDDLVIIVGGVGERAATVAVAERPDARDVGLKTFVDRDVAAPIERNAGTVEAEIVRIGPPAHGQQDIGAEDFGFTLHTIDADTHAGISPGKS